MSHFRNKSESRGGACEKHEDTTLVLDDKEVTLEVLAGFFFNGTLAKLRFFL